FISEVVRLLARDRGARRVVGQSLPVPSSVRDVVGLRVSRLSAACREALSLASVVGRVFDLATLAEALPSPVDRLLEVLGEAEAAHLISAIPATLSTYRFSHALVRETLYEGLTRVQRVDAHRHIAAALERRWANDAEHLSELAHHFLQAAPGGDA